MMTYNFANEGLRAQKTTNFLAGFVLALGALFVALEYTQREVKIVDEDIIYDYKVEEDMIPLTFHQEAVPAPPPAAAPTVAEIINEVQDDMVLIDEEYDIVDDNTLTSLTKGPGIANQVTDGPGIDKYGPKPEPIEIIRDFVPIPAEPPYNIYEWLKKNLKYPVICQEQGIQGRVLVRFVVNKDGSIEQVEIRRSPDNNLSNEALRVVNLMPKWNPARNEENEAVRSYFTLPITFRLN
jgi:protein TonB